MLNKGLKYIFIKLAAILKKIMYETLFVPGALEIGPAIKIILDKSDIIIAFLFVFLNIYYTFIELKGLIFFKMTYFKSCK